jgi:preprotein translocase subunit SecA
MATTDLQDKVKSLGGLFVLGTERHEARRIDNQLRGRSGRQGDPGETQFYVSLEDSLMRIFAGDRVKAMMGRFGIAEDEPIQNSMVSKALENAQGKIEGSNFDARKHLLEYDDVMNHQRKVIYQRRQAVLLGGKEATEDFIEEALEERPNAQSLQEAITKRKEEVGEDAYLTTARMVILQAIDTFWVEHLEVMDYLRGSVNLRAYGQRDPLVEYKREGLRLFQELEGAIFDQALRILPHVGSEAVKEERVQLEAIHESAQALTDSGSRDGGNGEVNHEAKEKIGRNDLCPCGSGKKYKNCGLINAPEHRS